MYNNAQRVMTAQRVVVGIDPGKAGGIAVIGAEAGVLAVHKMPDTPQDLARLFAPIVADDNFNLTVLVERVHSSPQMGVASAFTFGRGYGVIQGVLAGLKLRYDLVEPKRWQLALGCMSGGDKNITKARAAALYPEFKITHAVADALLIATYGLAVHAAAVSLRERR